MNRYIVVNAEYAGDYKLNITFADGKTQIVDFEPFLVKRPHPQYNKYRKPELFLQFKIESGNVVWGENWDLIFNPVNLYHNNLFKNYEKELVY